MSDLTLAQANAIIETSFAKAAEMKLKPLGVAALDAGGHTIAFQRQDGSSFLRYEIACGKAFGALAVGVNSRAVAKIATDRPHFFTGLSGVSGGKIIPVPGGVLIRSQSGAVIGAVGISGDTSDNDEACAIHAIEAAGLVAEKG